MKHPETRLEVVSGCFFIYLVIFKKLHGLMVSSPEKYLDRFVEADASAITMHRNCNEDLYYLITKINNLGIDRY
ncbi:hypothetical protein [Pediococcus sp.]|uniref:Uncharacterized protein n=1 Tax=Pediococcus parvulus TaxID=54062 RepID=A0AAP5T913_9LACO|nr:hypothetical protein [Pediococcus parvulus]HBO46555.1 hypothetical protein [Pediococcus sp.]MCT3028445.1 hypothetical protein [Pediococcus parvulus]MCT3031474.1 hypothetical protein [Pediococcus parvulus]MCT3034079.1 hypothetical protein [Pediococcus parvulus]